LGDDRSSLTGVIGQVVDTDDATLTLGDRIGQIVYVLPPLDWLPPPRPHVLARGPGDLLGRALANIPNSAQQPAVPLRVWLRVPAARIYPATVLACLPPLGVLRARLRNALTPAATLDATAVPVALADLPDSFRATGSALSLAPASDEAEAEDHALAIRRRLEGLQRLEAVFALERQAGDALVLPLLHFSRRHAIPAS
jgi:hypothetical protein